jgi:hypothetical protein
LLRCLVGDHHRTWDTVIPTAEFAYNSSVNRSTGMSPFEIVSGLRPRAPIDLIPMATPQRPSELGESFAHHIHALHSEIRRKINSSNEHYKLSADTHRRFREFQPGDDVMVRIRSDRFPPGSVKKLHARSIGPHKIVKRLGSNAYVVDIPPTMGISSTFNVEDLVPYHEPLPLSSDSPVSSQTSPIYGPWPQPDLPIPILPSLPSAPRRDEIEGILDSELVSTRSGGYQKFLVKWRNRPIADNSWITETELQRIDPDMLERYRSSLSPVANSSHPGRIDADISGAPFRVYQRRRRRRSSVGADELMWMDAGPIGPIF